MEIKNLLIEATKYINNQNLNESEIKRYFVLFIRI